MQKQYGKNHNLIILITKAFKMYDLNSYQVSYTNSLCNNKHYVNFYIIMSSFKMNCPLGRQREKEANMTMKS